VVADERDDRIGVRLELSGNEIADQTVDGFEHRMRFRLSPGRFRAACDRAR